LLTAEAVSQRTSKSHTEKCLKHGIFYPDLGFRRAGIREILLMKHSIKRQFALIFMGVMAGTILLCILINNLFLGQYYIRSKTQVIYDAYNIISQGANSDAYGTAEFTEQLNDVCNIYNITVCIMDANSQMKYESVNGGRELEAQLIGYIFGFYSDGEMKILDEGADYVIQRVSAGEDEYLEMYGRLNSGISFIMRTPIESIRESAKIANRFFAYVGIVGVFAGGIIVWFVSRKITQPILELNSISEQMVHLDFEAKYRGHAHNEIGLLGENINKLSASLEQSISELKTANNELQKDIEKKERIDEMRKEFLANVSHELKTPIALIQGYAEGLSEGVNDDSESRAFYCEVIMDEASKMNNMVKKLLTLNQLEFGNDLVSMERFDITSLVKNYIQSAAILTKQSGVTVEMEDYPAIYVWADEYKTEEVFMNYFSNALNHCGGEKKIVVSLRETDNLVRVSVFNTGDRIPEEAIPHLWEKFYKVDKARTREYGGSGVGLSIVKAIMESMNREFGVENCGNGVLFWFELER
jgi:signal transduction histidine kinase